MTEDDRQIGPDDIDLAIRRASEKSPKLARAREKVDRLVGGGDPDAGYRMLAQAIRRMLRQE